MKLKFRYKGLTAIVRSYAIGEYSITVRRGLRWAGHMSIVGYKVMTRSELESEFRSAVDDGMFRI